MKKMIALTAAALLLICIPTGCGASQSALQQNVSATAQATREQVRLSRGTTVAIDPAVESVEGSEITANDGSWRVTVHECYSAEELKQYREYFDKNVSLETNTDMVTEQKQLGGYTYDTAIYTANAQYFGAYFTAFSSPVPLEADYRLYGYSLSVWMEQNTSEILAETERVIDTLHAGAREEKQ